MKITDEMISRFKSILTEEKGWVIWRGDDDIRAALEAALALAPPAETWRRSDEAEELIKAAFIAGATRMVEWFNSGAETDDLDEATYDYVVSLRASPPNPQDAVAREEGVNVPYFNAAAFADCIKVKMDADELSFRQAAPIIGVSPATLNRIARGHPPDIGSYLRVMQWLNPRPAYDPTAIQRARDEGARLAWEEARALVAGIEVGPDDDRDGIASYYMNGAVSRIDSRLATFPSPPIKQEGSGT